MARFIPSLRALQRLVCTVAFAAVLPVAGGAMAQDGGSAGEDPVVARVDGDAVHLSDVKIARGLLPAQLQGQPLERVYPILVESLINSRLAAARARDQGLDESQEYQRRMARIGEQILERLLLTDYIESRVTDAALRERYDEMAAELDGREELHARHILVKAEDVAKAIIDQLDNGADFAELAAEHSLGPSAPRGGDLGWFARGEMVESFEDAAFDLGKGEHTETPVETQFGWHVIKVEGRRPVPVPAYEEARAGLVNEMSAELGRKLMTELRQDANIETKPYSEIAPSIDAAGAEEN